MFTRSFKCDDLAIRRANNILIKNKLNFAAIYRDKYWVLSIDDAGAKTLEEEGIVIA